MTTSRPPNIAEAVKRAQISTRKSEAYLARSAHSDGNIIVTTDDNGIIKVFRQDCAYLKRKHDNWETGSGFSRKLAGTHSGFGIARTGSIVTRTSASSAAHSRRGSLSQATASSILGSPHLGAAMPAGSSDRILSWRQDIEHGDNKRASSILSNGTPTTRSERSLSPTKASRAPFTSSNANLASEARRQPYAASPTAMRPQSQILLQARRSTDRASKEKIRDAPGKEPVAHDEPPIAPPAPSFTYKAADDDEDLLRLDPAGASYSFWNFNRWKGIAGLRGSISGPSQGSAGHNRSTSEAAATSPPQRTRHTERPVEAERENTDDPSPNVKKDKNRRKSLGPGIDLAAGKQPSEEPSARRRTIAPAEAIQIQGSKLSPIPTIELPNGGEDWGRAGRIKRDPRRTEHCRAGVIPS